jgi:hypothetical protein
MKKTKCQKCGTISFYNKEIEGLILCQTCSHDLALYQAYPFKPGEATKLFMDGSLKSSMEYQKMNEQFVAQQKAEYEELCRLV